MAGRGYFQKRGKESYQLVYSDGKTSDKKQRRITKTVKAKDDKEAQKLLNLFVAEIEKGLFIGTPKLTLIDFVERWISDYSETNLAPKTLFRYKQILDS